MSHVINTPKKSGFSSAISNVAVTSCRIEALPELRDEIDPLPPRPPGRILTAKADDGKGLSLSFRWHKMLMTLR